MLQRNEFINQESAFDYINLEGERARLDLPGNALAFTYCQVPVIYTIGDQEGINIDLDDGSSKKQSGLTLDKVMSDEVFNRSGRIRVINVSFDHNSDRFLEF